MEPTNDQLRKIETWDPNDLHGLMAFIKKMWQYADSGYWTQEGEEYHISTAGWSDNEEIIGCMMHNYVWWAIHWYQSNRGGHYVFKAIRS